MDAYEVLIVLNDLEPVDFTKLEFGVITGPWPCTAEVVYRVDPRPGPWVPAAAPPPAEAGGRYWWSHSVPKYALRCGPTVGTATDPPPACAGCGRSPSSWTRGKAVPAEPPAVPEEGEDR